MRISRLHLRAYGHFTDYSLKFGPEPGLHLVYGDNETGKTTTLRALSSALFGYPHEVADGFKHDAKDISIAVDLVANDGRRLSFVRKRRGKNALAYTDGSALDESVVTAFLGGASREAFEKVFALDHSRLREHARSLLAEGGSLGFSLAEAGSGIAGLKALIDGLRKQRLDLFRAGGSNPKVNQLISKLTELRKETRRRMVSPGEYKKHQKQIEDTTSELRDARDQNRTIEATVRRLQRVAKNLPLRAEHQALSGTIEELESVRLLPPEVTQQRVKAQTDRDAAEEDLKAADAAIEALKSQIVTIVLDQSILPHHQDIVRLAEQRPVIENADKDIPRRDAERAQHYTIVRDLMAKAELAGDPDDLTGVIPSALKRNAISTLAGTGTKLFAQRATASENTKIAATDLKEAEERSGRAPQPQDTGDLPRVLTAADKLGDVTAEISKRTRTLERKSKGLLEAITGLGLKNGDASALQEFVVPPDKTVARYSQQLTALDKDIETNRDTICRLDSQVADLAKTIESLKMVGDVATEDDLQTARNLRDEGWALIRALYVDKRSDIDDQVKTFAPDGQAANAYEGRVDRADHVADVIRSHVAEATELSLLTRQQIDIATVKNEAETKALLLQNRRNTLLEEWRTLWPTELVTPHHPSEMVEWLVRRRAILVEAEELENERAEIAALVDKQRDTVEALIDATSSLASALSDDSLDKLRDHARTILSEIAIANTEHAKANEAVRTQTARKNQAEQAVNDIDVKIDDWTSKWRAALEAAGLRPDLSIEAVSIVLEIMNSLDIRKTQIDDITRRINAMKDDRALFRKAVAALASCEPEAITGEPVQICRLLEARLELAQIAERNFKGLTDQLEIQTTAYDRALERLRGAKATLEILCEQAGCANPNNLAEFELKSAKKHQALYDRTNLERRVREDGVGYDLQALFAECDNVIGDHIPGEILRLRDDAEEIEGRIEQLILSRAKLSVEFDALLAQNQAADLMQEAANVEAEINENVEVYVDLTIQEVLLREAIDLYRDRNQGPILRRAKDLFAELTNGAYSSLRADINDKGEPILIAEDPIRGSLDIDALSDGTVDPLYLALRLAVVQEHNATREPLPFVADDLLLNLDNTRVQAALRTLAKIAESGQVLFFTHHAHMLDLARAAVPGIPGAKLVEHRLGHGTNHAN